MMRLISATLLICVVAACGIGGTETVEEIRPEEIAALDQTSTTTTTTTSPVETTEAPSVAVDTVAPPSGPVASGTTIGDATTTEPTEDVVLYFVNGSEIVPVDTPVESPVVERRVLAALGLGPPPAEFDAGVRTVIPPELVTRVRKGPAVGLITVDLRGELFHDVDPENQRYVVAQIVLTLTAQPGLDSVIFTVDGEPLRVNQRNGELTEPGEPVTCEDYEELLAEGECSA